MDTRSTATPARSQSPGRLLPCRPSSGCPRRRRDSACRRGQGLGCRSSPPPTSGWNRPGKETVTNGGTGVRDTRMFYAAFPEVVHFGEVSMTRSLRSSLLFFALLPVPLLCTVCKKFEGFDLGPTAIPQPFTGAPGSPYSGRWDHTFVFTAVGNRCGTSPSRIGMTNPPVSFTVGDDGTFIIRQGSGIAGKIDPSGVVTTSVVGPPPATCPTGSGTGTCADTSNCAGTFQQGGDAGTWRIARQP
jgi:hypothetical protein